MYFCTSYVFFIMCICESCAKLVYIIQKALELDPCKFSVMTIYCVTPLILSAKKKNTIGLDFYLIL